MPSKLSKTRRLLKIIMRSYKFQMPRGMELPIRLRPWFVGFTILVLMFLSLLGFTNIAYEWPFNHKVLHFICFAMATAVFYFVVDVDDDHRHIFFWKYFMVGLSFLVCLVGGGILSEFVRSLLPDKSFQEANVAANLLGASVGLICAYRLERYYRHRREVARLYQPVGESEASDSEEELLPTQAPKGAKGQQPSQSKQTRKNNPRIGNVWDAREDFDIGSASESDSDDERGKRRPTDPTAPQIIVSQKLIVV